MSLHSGRAALPSDGTAFVRAARTATPTPYEFEPLGATGLLITVDMTVDPGTDTVTFNVEGWDPASNSWYTILASAALTAVARTTMRIHPNLTAAANLVAADMVPARVRIRPVHSAATTTTYSVGVVATL